MIQMTYFLSTLLSLSSLHISSLRLIARLVDLDSSGLGAFGRLDVIIDDLALALFKNRAEIDI